VDMNLSTNALCHILYFKRHQIISNL